MSQENKQKGSAQAAVRSMAFAMCNSIKKVIVAYVVLLCGYGILYSAIEGSSFFDSVWQGIVTASTVGYGDISPATTAGKVLTGLFIMLTVYVFTALVIAHILMSFIEDRDAFTHEEQEELFSRQKQMMLSMEGLIERNEANRFTHQEQEELKAEIRGLAEAVRVITDSREEHGFTDEEQRMLFGNVDRIMYHLGISQTAR